MPRKQTRVISEALSILDVFLDSTLSKQPHAPVRMSSNAPAVYGTVTETPGDSTAMKSSDAPKTTAAADAPEAPPVIRSSDAPTASGPAVSVTPTPAPAANAAPEVPTIAIITCSTRKPRVCPQIATFVHEIAAEYLASHSSDIATAQKPSPQIQIRNIDLAAWNLPMFDDSTIPSQVHDRPAGYSQAHTRAWSAEIAACDAFIFVTPQYNWGYPASLKNAIDYLFHEWAGKPAVIVTYGGHGGDKCAAQLKQVLQGVRMRVVGTMPGLAFPDRDILKKAATGRDIGLFAGIKEVEEGKKFWDGDEKANITSAVEELVRLMSEEPQVEEKAAAKRD